MRIALENGSIDFGTDGPGDVCTICMIPAFSKRPHRDSRTGNRREDLLAKRTGLGRLSWK